MMKIRLLILLFLGSTLGALTAQAHEFWIEPRDYVISPGDPIIATLHVGQKFEGPSYAYFPQRIRRFDIALGDRVIPVEMRMGDRPALDMTLDGEGLAVIIHVTTDYTLRYSKPELFPGFVEHKDAAWALARHRERGLPDVGFVERYSRYAKSLVAIGDGAGSDRAFGLLTEIVALANPYADDLSDGLPVQVFYDGVPKDAAQVEIFERRDCAVTVSTVKADAEGKAMVPVRPGSVYMLDSVVIRELDPDENDGAVWESLWANLTFAVPG